MIYAFFPILAAMCYGLAFAFTEKALKVTNVATYMLLGAVLGFVVVLGLTKVKGEKLSWEFTGNKMDMLIVAVAVVAPTIGWVLTTYAIKNINAGYAAFAEISYPLFTVLFLFMFFGVKHFDWQVLAGGALILLGSFILVSGQLSKT